MKVKRTLSVLLALCMVLTLLPGLTVPAKAASVSYTRFSAPEIAILNYYTGGSGDFYESVLKDSRYNAVQAGKFADGGQKLKYDDEVNKGRTYTWSNFANSNLALLSDQTLQLKVSFSATLKNNFHSHSWWTSPFTKVKQETVGRMSASLYFPGQSGAKGIKGTYYSVQHSDYSKNANVRKGNASYSTLPEVFKGEHAIITWINGEATRDWSFRNDLKLQFNNHDYYYDGGSKTCSCGGSASGSFVGFYDGEAPKVKSVETRRNGVPTTDFKPGDTIQVVLKMSEPVRFADDSESGKENVCIALKMTGSASEPVYATLKSLTNSGYNSYNSSATWELLFEYKVPDTMTGLYNITAIDLKADKAPNGLTPLVHTSADITLHQLIGSTTFDVTKPSSVTKPDGFTKSSSYVTDIAGNALQGSELSVDFSVDGQRPFVAQTVMNATLNNGGIKDRKSEGEPEKDNSDIFLGVGDSFALTVYLNEIVDFTGKSFTSSSTKYLATATMNILDGSGQPVTAKLYWNWDVESKFLGDQFGLGASKRHVSQLKSGEIRIEEGMHLPEGETEIYIASITYDASYGTCDPSGNAPRSEVHVKADPPVDNLAPTMGYRLDAEGPTVTVDNVVQSGINTEFYVPFRVTDGTGPTDPTASGVQNMVGSVTLSAVSGEKSSFTYAVNGSAATDSQTVWKTGALDEKLSIVETGAVQYLHVKPMEDVRYDFSGLTVEFELSDYAGNVVTRTATLADVVLDNVKPVAESGSAERSFNNVTSQGVLTVPVTARDTCGLKNAWYLWAENGAEVSAESDGWAGFTFLQGESEIKKDVVVNVPNGDSFSKTLWIKAEDMAGNVAVVKKNVYSYNLEALHYELDYSTAVRSKAYMNLVSMEQDDGFFLVDVHKKTDEDAQGNATVHYINVGMKGGFAGGHTEDEGFMGVNFGWHKATIEEDPVSHVRSVYIIDNDVNYGWGAGEGTNLWSSSDGYGLGSYSGEIEVTIYSGTTQAAPALKVYNDSTFGTRWWYNSQSEPIVMDNSVGVEHITLRVVQENDNYIQYAESARIQCDFTYVDPELHEISSFGNYWSADPVYDNYDVNSSLAGMKVAFTLTDTYGWDFDGIDWENSYFRLNTYLGQQTISSAGTVRLCGIQPGAASQTIIFPATEIPSRLYNNLTLLLARTEAPDDPYQFYVTESDDPYAQGVVLGVEVDSTEPGSIVPGLLSYQPYVKFANYDVIDTEKSEDFPRTLIEYDPADVIYIPADNVRVDMMFQALTADGEIAYHRGRQAGYGQYDVVAWNTTADDPESTLTWLQDSVERNVTTNMVLNPCIDDYDDERFCFTLDDDGNVVPLEYAGQDYGQLCLTLNATGKDLVEKIAGKNFALTLIPDQNNVIAVQMRYTNGRTSDIVYLTVHPVSSSEPKGTVTVEPALEGESGRYPYGTIVGKSGETAVRFTPAEGESTAGTRFYLCNGFYRNVNEQLNGISVSTGIDGVYRWYSIDVRNPVEMTQQSDGSYLAFVPDYDDIHYGYYFARSEGDYILCDGFGLRHYVVVAQDATGSLHVLPSPTNAILTDRNGPTIDADPTADASDGTYAVTLHVRDESLYGSIGTDNYRSRSASAPLTLTFSYDEDYSAIAGAGSFSVVYDPAEAFEKGTVSYASGVTTVVYELPVVGNSVGITSVTATLTTTTSNASYALADDPDLEITVTGAISQKLTAPADVTLTVKAEDMFGHNTVTHSGETDTCEISTTLENAVGAVPHFVSAEYKLTGNTTDGWQQDRALYMRFSGPVQPVASWMCPAPQGYSALWAEGFPITHDGEWTISYYDSLDNLCTETITLTDVFGDYGIYVELSTTDYTEEAIEIKALSEGSTETTQSVARGDYLAIVPLPEDLQSFEDRQYGMNTGIEISRSVEENGDYVVLRAPYNGGGMAVSWHNWDYSSSMHFTDLDFRRLGTDYTIVHIGNYVNGRPGESVSLFFNDNMREYTAPLPASRQGETDSPVTITYRTDRETQPVGSGETSKTFRAGEDDSFSFTYYDPMTDAEYTISGRLSDYGVTLKAPETPPEDTAAPQISRVTVWKQLAGRFEMAEAFRGDADAAEIEDVFSVYEEDGSGNVIRSGRTGWAAGYDLVVNASDASEWKLLLCAEEPTALSLDTPGAEIAGVALQGNNVLITSEIAADAFWIAAVDAKGNFTTIRLQKSWFHFDTEAPVFAAADPVAEDDIFSRTIYLGATDDHTDASMIAFTGEGVEKNDGSNPGYPADVYPAKIVFRGNTAGAGVPVTATDAVGNSTVKYFTMQGIDDAKPTLTVTWSPCFRSDKGMIVNSATIEPTNVEVVAHIASDKAIGNVDGVVTATSKDYPGYDNETLLIVDPGYYWYAPNVYCDVSGNLATVHFTSSYDDYDTTGYGDYVTIPVAYHVALTVEATNYQTAEVFLDLSAGIVDQNAPYKDSSHIEYLCRPGYTMPYAYKAVLTFNEDVFLTGGEFADKPGELHKAGDPVEFTIADNEDHSLTIMDRAGNLNSVDLAPGTAMPVDGDAPEMEINNFAALKPVTSGSVTVEVRIDDESEIVDLEVSDPDSITIESSQYDTDPVSGKPFVIVPLSVSRNGYFRLKATDAAGNEATMAFGISNLDLTLPTVRFETSTITLRQGSLQSLLTAQLNDGVVLWDNVDDETTLRAALVYDITGVDLTKAGYYEVPYAVTDTAGNVGEAVRVVRVLSADLPEIRVDGAICELNGTTDLRPGVHKLTVDNLATVGEPYTVKLVKGIWSEGQLKYVTVGMPVAADGSFTISSEGFYTLYILTQSRMSYRTLLYAAN